MSSFPHPQDRSPWSNDPRFRNDPRQQFHRFDPRQQLQAASIPSPVPSVPQVETSSIAHSDPVTEVQPGAASTTNDPVGERDDGDFIEMNEVEWAQDAEENLSGELATRPRYEHSDPCGCTPDYNSKSCCVDMSCVLYACQEECGSNCKAGALCCNKRISLKQWKRLEVFDAGIKGRGLRALEPISTGDFVTEYVGRAIHKRYLESLFRRYKNERMLYIMALDNKTFLDARKKGSNARYINHSCEPNCKVERWRVRGILRAGVFALRDIAVGEELSFDYKWDRKRGRAPTKCHCLSPICRGTLELPRSLEEQELDRKLVGHWEKPLTKTPGSSIVNRSIRILSEEYHEYFSADVCKYDESTGMHLVMYTHDLEESWEDLSKEDWMILDEEAEKFVISRKVKSAVFSSSLVGMHMDAASIEQLKSLKNYMFLQTPEKQHLLSGRLIDRCEMNCHVDISIVQYFSTTPAPKDPEEAAEQSHALESSTDGYVWKLSISGGPNLVKAFNFLAKNVAFFQKKLEAERGEGVVKTCETQEVILPRCIVDHVKRRLPLIRDKCRSVQVNFAHSESKSKQFARLVLEATLVSDLQTATDSLWKQLVGICNEVGAPRSLQSSIPQDLGFMGGELSADQFHLLYESSKLSLRQACNENLRESPFFAAFETTQRCTVWVQTQDDKGRIDAQNLQNVVEVDVNEPRKIYFGCDPKHIPKLWGLMQTRASELSRGVKYLHLGSDKMYQQAIMRQGSRFFDYVKKVTGASVSVDSMTGNHLRIDGGPEDIGSSVKTSEESSSSSRAALAEEIIRLQIELYRDHFIRQQSWVFGRDWTLCNTGAASSTLAESATAFSPRPSSPSSRTNFDSRSVSNACSEIAEIVSCFELDGSVAAHAAIILYRFVTAISEKGHVGTQHKIRDLLLACTFLACKAQKASKWKRLEQLMEAAYETFYPGTKFDRSSQEAVNCEQRVISAETEILVILDYDIFWSGSDWILTAATAAGRVSEPLAKNALEFTFSGPVLGSGATLWLKYGPEYVFAAAAGFLSVPLDRLFSALSLIPLKVSQAAELIADSLRTTTVAKRTSSNELINGGKESLLSMVPRIREICVKKMSEGVIPGAALATDGLSDVTKRCHIIAQRDQSRRVFRGVQTTLMERIMRLVDGVSAESQCSVTVSESATSGEADIILQGNWRAMAIAEHLLLSGVSGETGEGGAGNSAPVTGLVDGKNRESGIQTTRNPLSSEIVNEHEDILKLQAKRLPGILQMSSISTAEGWDKTIQAKMQGQATSGGCKTGGKCCVAGKVAESCLHRAGLRWWIPPRYGPSLTGSICDMFCTRSRDATVESDILGPLAKLAEAFMGVAQASDSFPLLTGERIESREETKDDPSVAISLQRWPPEKVSAREQAKSSRSCMQIGFSPAALQEMQLLTQLHSLIPAPKGHPNFMLPVAVAVPALPCEREKISVKSDSPGLDEDIFSLFRTSEENELVAQKEKKRKDMVSGPHIVCQPTPFILHRLTSRSRKRRGQGGEESKLSPVLLVAWCHDLLSALVHCHTNNVVVRFFQPDQILMDHSAVCKLGGLYKATVVTPEERSKSPNTVKGMRPRKEKADDHNEDVSSYLYAAPEMLLGSKKHSVETDIWALGSLMAHLLLQKPLFIGKDRRSLLFSMFKIVGSPSTDNFFEATTFPNYFDPPKKYKRGVKKALQHMLKEPDSTRHASLVDLLAQMLHLDPRKRISAVDALSHDCMTQFVENSNSVPFREQYVKDWMSLKASLIHSTKVEEYSARKQEQSLKRKANFLMAASKMDNGEDDLYDMDDLLGGNSVLAKRARGEDSVSTR